MTELIRLPGLVDPHVHLREPGYTEAEDFESGTKAAAAGGFHAVLDMPNNPGEPTLNRRDVWEKMSLAQRRIHIDLGFHLGASKNDNTSMFQDAEPIVYGLKIYMNHTTGSLLIEDPKMLARNFASWPKERPVLVHAEGATLEKAIDFAKRYDRRLHVCHVSMAQQIAMIRRAKDEKIKITWEITPHHLFLKDTDVVASQPAGQMRPPLPTPKDQIALIQALSWVDCIATDHAPHTPEKKLAQSPANGIPGLETALPLMLTAVKGGLLTLERLVELMHTNPIRIFGLSPTEYNSPESFISIDPNATYTLDASKMHTKGKIIPFDGMRVTGRLVRSQLRGNVIYNEGQFLESPTGRVLDRSSSLTDH